MVTVRILLLCSWICFLQLVASAQSQPMTNTLMEELLKAETSEIQGQTGNWQMIYRERLVLILTDESNNRMRIFTPIIEEDKLEEGQMKTMLNANFHSALDSKYCLYNGFVISVYTHPLKELQEDQFIDALQQVVTLADTFGTTYSSTGLVFAPESSGEEEPEDDKRINQKPKNKN